ncbi:class I SAM-dependent methyltransferase [Shewanella corallii]|uniref:Class I SAM-dependent methyltransferase n=1 Tax=Shewanella corallii TaxID=560080 RepID=A0ABT0N3Q0_9GAMM|nr:class I SAM-dependent methyltransferase [Shewanella corallii]MCL2913052.1 class I SAM-dependent methyltransferase [Shewanella corallii]
MTQCGICGHEAWQVFEHLTFGVWQANAKQLTRDTKDYPLGQCQHCGHVQSLTEYSEELLQTLYFHGPQEQVFWHEQLVGSHFPYHQMVSLFAELLPGTPCITDLGCGPGALLKACRHQFPDAKLTGVDFNDRCALEGIDYISANIAIAENLHGLIPAGSQHLVCASHTLEHLPDPRAFLQAAAGLLTEDGLLFIEVPDFTAPLSDRVCGQSNLINLQHIHYFSESNLIALARAAGLDPIKVERLTTGYIPRLQMLMKVQGSKGQGNKTQGLPDKMTMDGGIRDNIEAARCHGANVRRLLVDQLKSALSNPDTSVALWGIGADAYLLLQDSEFVDLLNNPRLNLHDYQWAGHQLGGKTILGSDQLSDTSARIFLLPSLAETRVKMHALAKDWGIKVTDPYDPDNFRLPTPAPCQLCQTDQWRHLETLNTGIWDKSGDELVRKNLAFPVGECHHCGHVQITRPHNEQDIAALYFSGGGQPEMWPVRTDGSNAYREMVQAMGDALPISRKIADFGCGEGLLLKEMAAAHPDGDYLGIDFNPVGADGSIPRLRCDLNQQAQLLSVADGAQFDLITASHVLEHLVSPVAFLSALGSRLNPNGHMFIEVPDASFNDSNRLHETNLVHGQHLHYFTKASALAFAAAAGLECISCNQIQTDSIPRLQLLLKPGERQPLTSALQQTAVASITQRFAGHRGALSKLHTAIQEQLDCGEQVALWGIGGDFVQLLAQFPDLKTPLNAGRIQLFDMGSRGHSIEGWQIHCSSALPDSSKPCFIVPQYLPTRSGMLKLSRNWKRAPQ